MIRGFLKLRRGLFTHIRNGYISHLQALIFIIMAGEADPASGLWWGSSKTLETLYEFNRRTARWALESLETKGYIKRFPTQGSHAKYPILINKFNVTSGVHDGQRVNAEKTTDYKDIIFEDCYETVNDNVNETVNEGRLYKGTIDIRTRSKTFSSDSDEYRLSEKLFTLIRQNNPTAKEPNLQSWAKEADLMIRVDHRTPEEILRLIEWSQADHFWHRNILSMGKLREKFDKLTLEAKGGNSGNKGKPSNAEIAKTNIAVGKEFCRRFGSVDGEDGGDLQGDDQPRITGLLR